LDELIGESKRGIRKKVFFTTVSYVAGFSFVFIIMGATASYFGKLLFRYQEIIRIAGGLLIVVLGIHLTGLIRITFLDFEKRIPLNKKPLHVLGTFLVGMAFGVGWTPCIGPLLGSILVIAGSRETVYQGVILLAIYSAGLAIPFIILSTFIHFLIKFVKRATRFVKYVNATAGTLLILMGLLLLTNKLNLLAGPV
jgi:cytochrome c-type biogenesis protein